MSWTLLWSLWLKAPIVHYMLEKRSVGAGDPVRGAAPLSTQASNELLCCVRGDGALDAFPLI